MAQSDYGSTLNQTVSAALGLPEPTLLEAFAAALGAVVQGLEAVQAAIESSRLSPAEKMQRYQERQREAGGVIVKGKRWR